MAPEKNQRILITGIQGFIGKTLGHSLRKAGHDVWGVDIVGDPEKQVLEADLLEPQATLEAIQAVTPFSVIIHTAALAHGQSPPSGESCLSVNTKITENLLKAIEPIGPRMIFLSSVAIYGEDGRDAAVTVNDEPRPSTEYGNSKLLCEKSILESGLENCDILRLAPVFDEAHMKAVRKRVFLPGPAQIKIHLLPSPEYSLCRLDTVIRAVSDMIELPPPHRCIRNACDPKPYDQHEIASWFSGPAIPVPVFLLKPFYWMTFLVPQRFGYTLRCLYWKLFRSNTYSTDTDKTERQEG